MECAGLYIEDGFLKKNWDKDRLEAEVKANRELFRIDTSLRHADELPTKIAHIVALTIAEVDRPAQRQHLLEKSSHLLMNHYLLMAALDVFVVDQLPEWALEMKLEHLAKDCKVFLKGKRNDFKAINLTNNITRAFSTIIAEMTSTKGFGYPQTMAHYEPQWKAAQREIPHLVDRYSTYFENCTVPTDLLAVTADVKALLNGV